MYLDTEDETPDAASPNGDAALYAELESLRWKLQESEKALAAGAEAYINTWFKNLRELTDAHSVMEDQRVTIQNDRRVLEERGSIINALQSSTSWKITQPLRWISGVAKGTKQSRQIDDSSSDIYALPSGTEESGNLSSSVSSSLEDKPVSTFSLGYQSEYQENRDFTHCATDVNAIAFYLPQFHTIPENDQWWGKGFTEWTNTAKSKPRYEGHYQPREPHADIGYYDLTNIDTIKQQVKLAKEHGIYGFCFYYYWFSGRRLLERPLDMLMAHPEIDMPFCLCWANENWSKRWDGMDDHVLMRQEYSDTDPNTFIDSLVPYMSDSRYIHVAGKPLILVYNPKQIPDLANTIKCWRKRAHTAGIGDIHITFCKTFAATAETLGVEHLVDAEVEFPPHFDVLDKIFAGNIRIFDYQEIMQKYCREHLSEIQTLPVYRTAMLGWDNSARRLFLPSVYENFSLAAFYQWIDTIVKHASDAPSEQRYIFVNAWNEWAEGTYLEPDKKYGYANINTFSEALFGLPLSASSIQ